MQKSWSEKVSVKICLQSNLSHFFSVVLSPLRIRIIYCVLYLTVGKNGDLLTGLLVDVNVTSEMPINWKNIPL